MKTSTRAFVLFALLLTVAACGQKPEDAGRDYGRTLQSPSVAGVPGLGGLSVDQYGGCAAEAVDRYEDTDDQDAFFTGCKAGTKM